MGTACGSRPVGRCFLKPANSGSADCIGYAAGVFDLFHVGHVRLLQSARALCDRLVVGVSTDELASQKMRPPIIRFEDRLEVVRSCRHVDAAIPQEAMNKFETWKQLKFNILFVGNDWFNTAKWDDYERQLKTVGVRIVYLPYTRGRSSTTVNELIESERARITPMRGSGPRTGDKNE